MSKEFVDKKDDNDGAGDEELAIAARRGDREARNALFLRYMLHFRQLAVPAKRVAARWSQRDRSIGSEDVDQQLFIIFCQLLDSWQSARTPFIPYAINTMPWQALHFVRETMHYRSKIMAAQLGDNLLYEPEGEGNTETEQNCVDSPHAEVESRAAWMEHTAHLKPEWKYWLQLRFIQGMSSIQIAALSGCSRRTVNRELRAAMQAILGALQEGWEECA